MSSAAFLFRTTKSGAIKRSNLKGIDKALRKLDITLGMSTATKITNTRAVLAQCALWRANKAHKLVVGTANFSQHTADRAVVVDEVANQAMAKLKYLTYEQHKAHTMGHVPTAGANRRSLQHGHENERALYVQGKADARQQGTAKPVNFGGGSLVEANLQAAGINPGIHGAVPPAVQAILNLGLPFNQLNQAQFATLAAFFEHNNLSMQQPVHYATKDERVNDHMVIFTGGLIQKEPGQNYNTLLDMWAMDRHGNFLCTAAGRQVQVGPGNYQYNHSSLNAGREVICAGTVVINNGVIMEIDNNSGHYRPTRQNLHSAVLVLHHDLGATFDANCVIRSHANPKRRFNDWNQFVGNVNAAGVWP